MSERCGHDSGSATGNQLLCHSNATQRVTYPLIGMGCDVTVERCDRHAVLVRLRAAPHECTTEMIR